MKIVIVTGISGIDKSRFIRKLVTNLRIGTKSVIIKFEDKLVDPERGDSTTSPPTTITAFLDQPSLTDKVRTIEETFTWISRSHLVKEYVFLDVHLTYYKNSEYFPPLNPSNYSGWISSICIDAEIVIINLIDDVFNIWRSICDKDRQYPNTKLTLREILGWRSVEFLQSESLTSALNSQDEGMRRVRRYMVSVRHPPSTFRNLLLPKTPLCFYLSYPISKTRQDPDKIEEVNKFRLKMHDLGKRYRVAIFDPVSIDELCPGLSDAASDPIVIGKNMRWPLDHENLAKEPPMCMNIPAQEFADSKSQIKHQIRSRDFNLVESSRVLAVFRPYFGGESIGVREEIHYAISRGKTVLVYSPPEDEQAGNGNPFDNSVETIDDESRYYKRVVEIMESLPR